MKEIKKKQKKKQEFSEKVMCNNVDHKCRSGLSNKHSWRTIEYTRVCIYIYIIFLLLFIYSMPRYI